ncbi:DUF2322 family protein [Candidatus Woesearchaeota archaeon]|nr:DUF2322 family protein [Candidatus Woesearchaeota archaeon]
MVNGTDIMEFNERLSQLPSIDHIALGRVYDHKDNLLTIIPNLPGTSGSLRIFYATTHYEITSPHEVLSFFGDSLIADATGDKHPSIQLALFALKNNQSLRFVPTRTETKNLLKGIINETATPEQKFEGAKLLQSGEFRTAEKTYGVEGDKPLWEPQAYAIAALNNAFGLFTMGTYEGMPQFMDKLPLWVQNVNLKDGIKSPYFSEQELLEKGVRLIPGSFARFGAYIGKGTTIMPGGIVNIGAYIAGDVVMVDGGARVASGAQVGKNVKIGAGTGLEGVLEPAGMMPTIVEDNVRIGANCEITGIIGEGALIASGVVMAAGKKIYDERTEEFLAPLYVKTAGGIRAVPHIPPNRIAVGGTYMPEGSRVGKDTIILLEKNASESSFMDVPKNSRLYHR